MTIKPIKTERDYQKALKEIEKLWDAKPNTPKGDQVPDGAARAKNNRSCKDSGRSKPSFRGSE